MIYGSHIAHFDVYGQLAEAIDYFEYLYTRPAVDLNSHVELEEYLTNLKKQVRGYRKAGKYDGDVKRGLLDIINLIETKI